MIPLFKVLMSPAAPAAVERTLLSGFIGQGPRVDEFEHAFGKVVDAPAERLIAVNSCTSAIDLALHLCGVGPGDEVVTTPMTCTATNTPIVTRGAVPVWADVDRDTGNIDPADVARKVTPRTKAIVAVNWGGRPCDHAGLKQFGPPVIEDAAHCLSPHHGGDYVCWSFQAIKQLTTGDGGMLLAPADQAGRARLLRWYGLDRKSSASSRCAQRIAEAGYKYHMNDIAATIGLANLPLALEMKARACLNVRECQKHLDSLPGFQKPPPDARCCWWLYTLLVERRDEFMAVMKERGVETSPVHARNDVHPAFQLAARRRYRLPGVDWFAARNVAIPVGWWLSADDRSRVIDAVLESLACWG